MTMYTPADEQLFALVGRAAVDTSGGLVGVDGLVEQADPIGLPRQDVLRSLRYFAENHLITLGPRDRYVQLTESGIERWARDNLEYEAIQDKLGRDIVVAEGRTTSRLLGNGVDAPDMVVRHVIRNWGNTGELNLGDPVSAHGEVVPVRGMSESFRRKYGGQ